MDMSKKKSVKSNNNDEIYYIADANRLRLQVEKGLKDTGFKEVLIEGVDLRTVSFENCKAVKTTFKNCIFQGCNMSGVDFKDVKFEDCDLRWGKKPSGFKENNDFINTRL